VTQNVLRCTVSGVVASFWYTPEDKHAVVGALRRATTTSLGSVCLGSLGVAVVEGVRAAVQSLYTVRCVRGLCVCVADLLLGCAAAAWRCFNRWAFVMVGVWGYDFMAAGGVALDLLAAKGWTAVLEDYLVAGVLSLGSVTVCVCMCVFRVRCV
jgi:hypothetical protein